MLDARLRRLIDPPLDRLSAPLVARGISANAVTVAGFALGLGAAAAIAGRAYLLGLALLLLNRLCDGLDGAVARRRGLTDLGGFLDIVLDFLIYAAVPFAFALADPAANAPAAAFLIFSFMGTGSSFLAYAIMAAKRGVSTELRGQQIALLPGRPDRGHRDDSRLRAGLPVAGAVPVDRPDLRPALLADHRDPDRGRRADPALNGLRKPALAYSTEAGCHLGLSGAGNRSSGGPCKRPDAVPAYIDRSGQNQLMRRVPRRATMSDSGRPRRQ